LPVPESGEVLRFSVKLPAKYPETGRSGYHQKWQSGPAAGPDGVMGGCSPLPESLQKNSEESGEQAPHIADAGGDDNARINAENREDEDKI
jgi:hypothetical protein